MKPMKQSKAVVIDVTVTEARQAIKLGNNNWIYDWELQYFKYNEFVLKNVTEKEDEEEWWRIYGPGMEVSGKSPEECIEMLLDLYNTIGEVLGQSEVP